jgi:hypothetical protein
MASNVEVFEAFLLPMKRLFLRPPHASDVDESAALSEYADALKAYSKAVLLDAWKEIRDGQTGRYWPPIAVCLKVCRGAKKSANPAHSGTSSPIEGRMVDGVWQPWIGCECARCLKAREQYRKDNSSFAEFAEQHYPIAPIQAQIRGLSSEERFALLRRLMNEKRLPESHRNAAE